MKISKISSWVPGLSVGVLVLTVGLVVLGAISRSFIEGGFTGESEDFTYVNRTVSKKSGYPPVFAYWIYGNGEENGKILRLLKAVYHPRNRYLLHLGSDSSYKERRKLALSVQSERVFRAFGNVDVVGSSYPTDQMGSSALAATLHGAALLLKINDDWDWFITLRTSDYPIVTQDDLLHAFTFLPRDLNFIHYYNKTEWKEEQVINQIFVDPNLHHQKKTPISYTSGTRDTPNSFNIFQGSSQVIITRDFVDYCVQGWDNLPRTLLMYFTNVAYPLEAYFQTVLCNTPEFHNTSVNNNLRYIIQDTLPHMEPNFLNLSHYERILERGVAFARWSGKCDLLVRKMDQNILRRPPNGFVPGKWCLVPAENQSSLHSKQNSCSTWGNVDLIEPSPYGVKFGHLLSKLAETRTRASQCNQ